MQSSQKYATQSFRETHPHLCILDQIQRLPYVTECPWHLRVHAQLPTVGNNKPLCSSCRNHIKFLQHLSHCCEELIEKIVFFVMNHFPSSSIEINYSICYCSHIKHFLSPIRYDMTVMHCTILCAMPLLALQLIFWRTHFMQILVVRNTNIM